MSTQWPQASCSESPPATALPQLHIRRQGEAANATKASTGATGMQRLAASMRLATSSASGRSGRRLWQPAAKGCPPRHHEGSTPSESQTPETKPRAMSVFNWLARRPRSTPEPARRRLKLQQPFLTTCRSTVATIVGFPVRRCSSMSAW